MKKLKCLYKIFFIFFEYTSQYVAIIQVILVFKDFPLIYFKWMPQYQTVVFFMLLTVYFVPFQYVCFKNIYLILYMIIRILFNIIVNDSENLKFIHLKLMYPFK